MSAFEQYTVHQNEVQLVNLDGTLTDDGLRLGLDKKLSSAQREAMREQRLRQEVFGTKAINRA